MKRLTVMGFIVIWCMSGCASSNIGRSQLDDMLSKAAIAYQSGAYDKAIALYEEIRLDGLANGELFYNLGNAYLKKNDTGYAVLNYTRAKYYIPRDNELLANYDHAIVGMKQKDPGPRSWPFILELLKLFGTCTVKETSMIFFSCLYLMSILIICVVLNKRYIIISVTFILILTTASALASLPLFDKMRDLERGMIVVNPIIDAKTEPYDDAVTGFPLYAGMRCYIMKERIGWVKIQRPDGRLGWVPVAAVRKVW